MPPAGAGVSPGTPALRRFPRPFQVEMPLLTRASRIRVSSSAERIDDRARSSEKTWYADSTRLLTPLMVEVQVHSVVAPESNWAPQPPHEWRRSYSGWYLLPSMPWGAVNRDGAHGPA